MKRLLIIVCFLLVGSGLANEPFNSWADFDDYIQSKYGDLENPHCALPPFDYHFGLSLGTFPFNAAAFADLTNATSPRVLMGVPAYEVRVRETNDASRVFIAEAGGTGLQTNGVSAYDAEAWVRTVYGEPPEWLSADELAVWYKERYRDRVEFCVTLIPAEHYELYQANARAAVTNYLAHADDPAVPANTNGIAFAKVKYEAPASRFNFQLYSPYALPIDIFTATNLHSHWSYVGTVNAAYPFTPSGVCLSSPLGFVRAARGDIDTDGDGIPDGMETLQFGTNPHLWDSCGDGLSDWLKLYRYGLDPLSRDSDGDGYDDDEEIATGQNPSVFNGGASATIRYVYDDDDRLTGSYSGAGRGVSAVTLTPAGNPAVLRERCAK